MSFLGRLWKYRLKEPLWWLFLCIFQPVRFQHDIVPEGLKKRMAIMWRMLLPVFLCCYVPALCLRVCMYVICPSLFPSNFVPGTTRLDLFFFFFQPTWACALSCLIGGPLGALFGLEYGVAFALAGGIVDGACIGMVDDSIIVTIFGLISGLMLGLTFNHVGGKRILSTKTRLTGMMIGIITGIVIGIITGLFIGYAAGIPVRMYGVKMHIADITNDVGPEGNAAGMTASIIVSCLVTKILGLIVEGSSREEWAVVAIASRISLAVAGITAASVGVQTGDDAMGNTPLQSVIASRSLYGLLLSGIFLIGYMPGYYKIPLYPISACSMLFTWLRSSKYPSYVFHYLRHSSLHWDERSFVALPGLRQTLSIAAEQNIDETLTEIDFILRERSEQQKAATTVALEIALEDLSQRESLRDIAAAQQRLTVAVPWEIRYAHQHIAYIVDLIENVSRDAINFYTQISWQIRSDVLEKMQGNLQRVARATVPPVTSFDQQLAGIIQQWQRAVTREQNSIRKLGYTEKEGRIENPYVPGLVLTQRDPLFVGRKELALQLTDALSGGRPPTFFLTGERRMGKSSILKQLPDLLGSHYIPIFFDMQSTGITSSAAALLATIAEEVREILLRRGLLVRELTYEQLKEDQKENEAVAYHRFSRWMKEVERALAQNDRVLLLAFDEFEKLAEAEQKGYLDLSLLFAWFRSTIQTQSRLVLLFSGVRSIGEMGAQWAGYFANVEILKVSFLQFAEAYQLITRPIPDFPGQRIFEAAVAEEIMRVTGCHPFLVQALCSIMISRLNDTGRQHSSMEDVRESIEEVFFKWEDSYFKDLWERTDKDQRLCLKAIHMAGRCNAEHIRSQCGLDATSLNQLLKKLLKRDLISPEEDSYTIATPIFERWIERNN